MTSPSAPSTSTSIPPRKAPLFSLPDLKGTTDDTIPQLLTSSSWLAPTTYTIRQDHTLANVRLALGYTSLALAAALFYADWKLGGWEVTRPYTLPACVVYFALNGALSYWIWAVERGTIFRGVVTAASGGGERGVLTLRSSVKKNEPVYHSHVEGRFSEWFNMYGYIDKPALKSWLAKNINVIGEAVSKNDVVVEESNNAPTVHQAVTIPAAAGTKKKA
ncbi:hypothetical protein DV735_g2482, partial [Chaetothyriales sp. CBS 134920]